MIIASRLLCAAVVLVVACAPSPSGAPSARTDRAGPAEGPPKSVSLGTRDVPAGFGAHNISWSGGAATVVEIHSNGLVTNDLTGGLEPRLAAKLPSFDDGTTAILPDGRLQDTWKLRPNIRWQDGPAFTAEDMAFAYQVLSHPDSQWGRSEIFLRIDQVRSSGTSGAGAGPELFWAARITGDTCLSSSTPSSRLLQSSRGTFECAAACCRR